MNECITLAHVNVIRQRVFVNVVEDGATPLGAEVRGHEPWLRRAPSPRRRDRPVCPPRLCTPCAFHAQAKDRACVRTHSSATQDAGDDVCVVLSAISESSKSVGTTSRSVGRTHGQAPGERGLRA